jgi:hypothetical protein
MQMPALPAVARPLGIFLITILALSTAQWISVQFLASYCSPWGWYGPIANLLSLGSPVCHFVNKFQVALADHYITIWASALAAAVAWFIATLKAPASVGN